MNNPQQLTTPAETHQNRGLFSDHYLNEVVPTSTIWHDGNFDKEVKVIRDELRALLESIQPEKLSEAQLENQWVQPVLEKLGHRWFPQIQIRYRDTGYRKPDYGFTWTQEEARALTKQIYEPAQITHLLGVGFEVRNLAGLV